MPVQNSILSILVSSEAHSDALLKRSNELQYLGGIATEELEHMVRKIVETNHNLQ